MKYTVNEKNKTFTLHEADTPVTELTKLLEKYKGYRIHVNIGETSINLITDSGYTYAYKPGENPYEIIGGDTMSLTHCEPGCACKKHKKNK